MVIYPLVTIHNYTYTYIIYIYDYGKSPLVKGKSTNYCCKWPFSIANC